MSNRLHIDLTPRRVARTLGGVAIALAAIHIVGMFLLYVVGLDDEVSNFLINHINLEKETNIPTMFQTFLFLANAGLLAIIWRVRRPAGKPNALWLILVIIFAFLAIDEYMSHHEGLTLPVRAMLSGTSGLLRYAWVVPYGLAALLLAALYAPLVLRLGGRVRNLFILAAAVYLSGALGFEMIGGWYLDLGREPDFLYGVLVGFEETLEAGGLIIFVSALLTLLQRDHGGLAIELPPAET